MKNIYLCGFMGCGKSYIGQKLSQKLNLPLIDLDSYIIEQEKMTIPEIFEQKGEQYFRNAEAKYIRELKNCVIATGGGAMLRSETAEYAKANGVRVFINTAFEVCYDRIKDDKNRPLVQKNTVEELHKLYTDRKPIYERNTDFSVDGNASGDEITDSIIRKAKEYDNL